MVELAGIVAAAVIGGWLCEVGRRALLGSRLQRSMALSLASSSVPRRRWLAVSRARAAHVTSQG